MPLLRRRRRVVVLPAAALVALMDAGCERPSRAQASLTSPTAVSASLEARAPAGAVRAARSTAPNPAVVLHAADGCGIWGGFIGFNNYMFGARFSQVLTPRGSVIIICTNGPIAPGFVPARTVVVKALFEPFGNCTYRYLPIGKAEVVCINEAP